MLKFNPTTGRLDLVSDPATTTAQGIVKLAGDLTGTANAPTIKADVALSGNPTTTTQASSDNSTRIATTAYVTTGIANAIAGVNPATAVLAATTTNLAGYTYNNGVSGVGATLTQNSAAVVVIDGYTLLLNDRVLIKDQLTTANNGVYTITTLGTGIIPAVFTRATDFNQPSDINTTGAIPVINGITNVDTTWVVTSKVTTVGTDPITFTRFSLNPSTILTNTLSPQHILVGSSASVATDNFLLGTANQVSVAFSSSTVTLSTPQDIATTSSPQFVRLGIAGPAFTNDAIAITNTPQTGGAIQYGVVENFTFQAAATTSMAGYRTANAGPASITTAAGYGYWNSNLGLGASASMISQYGFYTDDLTSGQSNYGYYSNLSSGTNKYAFYSGSNAKSYFNGSVGIGTLTPAVPLHVLGSSGVVAGRIETSDSTSGQQLLLGDGSNQGAITFVNSGFATTARRNNLEIFSQNTVGGITFHTNNNATPKMSIVNNGNVGLAITPTELLEVAGNIKVNGIGRQIKVGSSGSNMQTVLDIDFPDVSSGTAQLRLFRSTNTSNPRQFIIFKGDGSAGFQTILDSFGDGYINALAGNLGVGTASPNANAILDVTSTTKAFMPPRMTTAQKNAVSSPTAGMVVYDSTLAKLSVYSASTSTWQTVTSA